MDYTQVKCNAVGCKHNKVGNCAKLVLTIENGVCKIYAEIQNK